MPDEAPSHPDDGWPENEPREHPTTVVVLALCEIAHLFLNTGVLYRFVAMDGCEKCAWYARKGAPV